MTASYVVLTIAVLVILALLSVTGPNEPYFRKTLWLSKEEVTLIREYYRVDNQAKTSDVLDRQDYIIKYLGVTWTQYHSGDYDIKFL